MTETLSQVDSSHGALHKLVALGRDIKLAHSVFALPFALLATFLAAGSVGHAPSWATLALIVLCMVTARTVAMAVNRWADAAMDAANPRTAQRAIPRGALDRSFVLVAIAVSAALFWLSAWGFWWVNANVWPGLLAPLVLAYLAGYSFTKRFTAMCHLVLGGALALSPIAAVIAVRPAYLAQGEPWLLVAAVVCWVAGFDVIYALQDLTFDRAHGVLSIPAKLGAEPALWVSRALHALTAAALIALAGLSAQLSIAFAIATGIVVALLALEHALVWGSNTHRIPLVFVTVNGCISLVLGAAGIVDVLRAL